MERSSSVTAGVLDVAISILNDLKKELAVERIRLLNGLLLESAQGHSNVTLRLIQEGATNLDECIFMTNDKTYEAFKNVEWAL